MENLYTPGAFASRARGRKRGTSLRCGCTQTHGPRFDCGHSHVDEIAPGYFRGVVLPILLVLGGVTTGGATVAVASMAAAGRTSADDHTCPDPTLSMSLSAALRQGGADFLRARLNVASLLESELGHAVLCTWAACLVLLVAVVFARAFLVGTSWLPAQGAATQADIQAMVAEGDAEALERCLKNEDVFAERLAQALRCKTISYDLTGGEEEPTSSLEEDQEHSKKEFDKLFAVLRASFPLVHARLERTVVNGHSLVFKWRAEKTEHAEGLADGDPPPTLPYLVYAHMDVVPAGDASAWEHPPFQGVVAGGYVWGRGAIDDKQAVMGHLEAVEDLLAQGFEPSRDVYLAFGHDEECSGFQGAAKIAQHFTAQGVHKFDFMLDEGLFVITDVVPGHKNPVAMVCTSEKGYVTVKLSVSSLPGHASQPPVLSNTSGSPVGILAQALSRLERNPMSGHFSCADAMLSSLAGGFSWPLQLLMSNTWLFSPLLLRVFSSKPTTSTLVRTTTALTVVKGGSKSNVLPAKATALVNHRIHPKDSVAKVIAHDVKTINDPRVQVEVFGSPVEPAPVSSVDTKAFHDLRASVREVFPNVAVAPGLFVAASDSRHFWAYTDSIYRFNPVTLHASETSMFHGDNERISVRNYAQCVAFFRTFHVRSNQVRSSQAKN